MTDYSNDKPWMPPPVVLNLLIINTIVFLATIWLERMGYYNITNMLALNSIATGRFGIWQLVTYMFMHASLALCLRSSGGGVDFCSIIWYVVWGQGYATSWCRVGDSRWVLQVLSTDSCLPLACFSPTTTSISILSCPSRPNGL